MKSVTQFRDAALQHLNYCNTSADSFEQEKAEGPMDKHRIHLIDVAAMRLREHSQHVEDFQQLVPALLRNRTLADPDSSSGSGSGSSSSSGSGSSSSSSGSGSSSSSNSAKSHKRKAELEAKRSSSTAATEAVIDVDDDERDDDDGIVVLYQIIASCILTTSWISCLQSRSRTIVLQLQKRSRGCSASSVRPVSCLFPLSCLVNTDSCMMQ